MVTSGFESMKDARMRAPWRAVEARHCIARLESVKRSSGRPSQELVNGKCKLECSPLH